MTGDLTEPSKRNDKSIYTQNLDTSEVKIKVLLLLVAYKSSSLVWSPSTLQQVRVWNFLQSWSLQVLYCCSLVCIFVRVCIDGVRMMTKCNVCVADHCSHTWCICSLRGQWDFSVQSSVAVRENDRVCPARHQRFALQRVRLLVRVRGLGDSRGWRGQVRVCECRWGSSKKKRKRSQESHPAGAVKFMTSVTRRAGRFLDAQPSVTFPTSSTMTSPVQTNRWPAQVRRRSAAPVCVCRCVIAVPLCHSIIHFHKYTPRKPNLCADSPASWQRPTIFVKPPSVSATGWQRTASLSTPTTPRTRTWILKCTARTDHRASPRSTNQNPLIQLNLTDKGDFCF